MISDPELLERIFSQAWGRASTLESATTEAECRELLRLALFEAEGGHVVEIGTYKGRTAAILGTAARCRVTLAVATVDPFEPFNDLSSPQEGGERVVPSTPEDLRRTLDSWGLRVETVEVIRGRSAEVARDWPSTRSVSLLFIDGDHSPLGVASDWLSWMPHLKTNAIIAWHDYHNLGHARGRWDGVRRTVDQLIESGLIHPISIEGCLLATRYTPHT